MQNVIIFWQDCAVFYPGFKDAKYPPHSKQKKYKCRSGRISGIKQKANGEPFAFQSGIKRFPENGQLPP
jgi:hypothetical protein